MLHIIVDRGITAAVAIQQSSNPAIQHPGFSSHRTDDGCGKRGGWGKGGKRVRGKRERGKKEKRKRGKEEKKVVGGKSGIGDTNLSSSYSPSPILLACTSASAAGMVACGMRAAHCMRAASIPLSAVALSSVPRVDESLMLVRDEGSTRGADDCHSLHSLMSYSIHVDSQYLIIYVQGRRYSTLLSSQPQRNGRK